jgi:hypothetical protein
MHWLAVATVAAVSRAATSTRAAAGHDSEVANLNDSGVSARRGHEPWA